MHKGQGNRYFDVLTPGVLSLITDAGRFGKHHLGLTVGGPMDTDAFIWANMLCSNTDNQSCIEVTLGGLEMVVNDTTQVALTGAPSMLRINGVEQPMWQSQKSVV